MPLNKEEFNTIFNKLSETISMGAEELVFLSLTLQKYREVKPKITADQVKAMIGRYIEYNAKELSYHTCVGIQQYSKYHGASSTLIELLKEINEAENAIKQ